MLLPKQVWKDIPGYENKYQVSNTGKVRSLNYHKSNRVKNLKQGFDNDGYKKVTLYKNSKAKTFLVHRLVAQAFISNPQGLPQVNHIDENKTNNCVWNLEWCDVTYNNTYGTRIQKSISTLKSNTNHKYVYSVNNPSSRRVRCIETSEVFECIAEAEEKYHPKHNRKAGNIHDACRGRQRTAYGYHWEYIN